MNTRAILVCLVATWAVGVGALQAVATLDVYDSTDLVTPIRSDKTIYVRFDLNDYSIPPEAVGRPLTG